MIRLIADGDGLFRFCKFSPDFFDKNIFLLEHCAVDQEALNGYVQCVYQESKKNYNNEHVGPSATKNKIKERKPALGFLKDKGHKV